MNGLEKTSDMKARDSGESELLLGCKGAGWTQAVSEETKRTGAEAGMAESLQTVAVDGEAKCGSKDFRSSRSTGLGARRAALLMCFLLVRWR
jgi:hypothetical protein